MYHFQVYMKIFNVVSEFWTSIYFKYEYEWVHGFAWRAWFLEVSAGVWVVPGRRGPQAPKGEWLGRTPYGLACSERQVPGSIPVPAGPFAVCTSLWIKASAK